jgi:hypothetical protein
MKIYKHDKRFAIKETPYGWIDVLVKDEFTGEYKVEYKVIDLEAAYQVVYSLSGKKQFVTDEDFEEAE